MSRQIDKIVKCSNCDKELTEIVGEFGPYKAKVKCRFCNDYSFIIKYSTIFADNCFDSFFEGDTMIILTHEE